MIYIIKNIVKVDEKTYLDDLKAVASAFSNIELILLTCGENGAYTYECKKDLLTYQESFKVKVVSTVGAGDCFGATFLVNYLSDKMMKEELHFSPKPSQRGRGK